MSQTELGKHPGNSVTLSVEDFLGFKLDPEKIKDIDREKTRVPVVDMRRVNDEEYMKEIEEQENKVREYLKQFAIDDNEG